MNEIYISLENDGAQWLPYDPNVNLFINNDENRRGVLVIDHEVITDPFYMAICSQISIVRCESDFMKRAFVIHAYSRHFRQIPLGVEPPMYSVICHKDESGRLDWFKFEETKPLTGV